MGSEGQCLFCVVDPEKPKAPLEESTLLQITVQGVHLADGEKILFTLRDMTHIYQYKHSDMPESASVSTMKIKNVIQPIKTLLNQLGHVQ